MEGWGEILFLGAVRYFARPLRRAQSQPAQDGLQRVPIIRRGHHVGKPMDTDPPNDFMALFARHVQKRLETG